MKNGHGYTDSLERVPKLLEEIKNPKEVPKGMYKVPHKYLFEIIRARASDYEEAEANDYNHDYYDYIGDGGKPGMGLLLGPETYLDVDGKFTLEQGEFLEKLYADDDYYILQHAYNPEIEPNKEEVCFEKGKKESYKGQKKQVQYTFNGNFGNFSFVDLLDCNNHPKILAYIKKSDFHEKEIWGADSEEESADAYLLPQYIIGSLDTNFTFKCNPVPIKDRKEYKYHFKDRDSAGCRNNEEEEVEK